MLYFFMFILMLFHGVSFGCDLKQVDNIVVLRHPSATHVLDNKMNALNSTENSRSMGFEIYESHITLGGVTKELKKTAEDLKKIGISASNSCIVSSENIRALETAVVLYDYLSEKNTFGEWELPLSGDEKLSIEQEAILRKMIAQNSSNMREDNRLREGFFGFFEGKSYKELNDASNKIITAIDESPKDVFTVSYQLGSRPEKSKYEKEPEAQGPVYQLVLDLSSPIISEAQSDMQASLRISFQAKSLREAQEKLMRGQRVKLSSALGAESKPDIFLRVLDFLKNQNELKAKIADCCEKFGNTKFNIILSTHATIGAQLISFLFHEHDNYPGENYKMESAEAFIIPMTPKLVERLEQK